MRWCAFAHVVIELPTSATTLDMAQGYFEVAFQLRLLLLILGVAAWIGSMRRLPILGREGEKEEQTAALGGGRRGGHDDDVWPPLLWCLAAANTTALASVWATMEEETRFGFYASDMSKVAT